MSGNQSALANLISRLAKERGISQRQIGLQSGLSESAFKHMLNGNTKSPRVDTVAAMARTLGLPAYIFIGGHALRADIGHAEESGSVAPSVSFSDSSAQIVQSADERSWINIWRDMDETQRRRAIALLRAMVDSDAA